MKSQKAMKKKKDRFKTKIKKIVIFLKLFFSRGEMHQLNKDFKDNSIQTTEITVLFN